MNTGVSPAVKSQSVAGMLAPTDANSQGARPLFVAAHKSASVRR
jgi:hypothetical protein